MKKYIKFLLLSSFCASTAWGQTGETREEKDSNEKTIPMEYMQGVAYDVKESTVSASVAGTEDLTHKTVINGSNLLYGILPGLQVLQNPGNAWDDGASLYIRGVGTLSNKSPLILVDGFERSLNYLNGVEIESITVLKDAASTSLYGVKGANGVILVKTKRGSESAPEIDFSYHFNMGTPRNLPNMVDAYTYGNAMNEALRNDGVQEPRYSEAELQAFRDGTYPSFYPNVDWWNEAIRDHSYGDNVNFSARGGGKFVKYYSQLNFLDDRGILNGTDMTDGYSTQFKYSRLNVRTNLDIQLSKTTQVKLNMFGSFTEHNRPGTQTDDIFAALYKVPAGAFPVKTNHNVWGGTTVYSNNPVANISGTGYARSQSRALFADMELKQDLGFLVEGLNVGVRLSLDNYGTYWDNNTKSFGYEMATIDLNTGEETYTNLRDEKNMSFSSSVGASSNHFNFDAFANYSYVWNNIHKLNATLQYSMDKDTQKDQNASRSFINVAAQAHYMYKDRYIVDASLTGSASSVLEPGNQWGVFPAVGLGWLFSEEDFLKKDWLNLLKLRFSYGISGRADYDMNLFRSYYGGGNSYYFKDSYVSMGGMKEARLGMTGFTYEKSHKTNVGIDFMAWNKLAVTLDGFYDHRTDILVDGTGTVSSVLGISVPKQNAGVVDSYGMEMSAKWSDRIGNFSYNVGAMFSYVANEIKEMNEEYRPYDYLKRTGNSVGQIFGYEVEGIYQTQKDIDNREVKQYLGVVRPGDLMFKDQNGDKRIDAYDQVPLGYNSTCPELYYSIDLGVEYKGVGLYAMFQGTDNYSKVLDAASMYRPLVNNNTISTHYYENRWTPDNPHAMYPRLTYSGSENNYNTNSVWVTDASYLKLRTLELYYQIPSKALERIDFLKKTRLFARAHDLFSWDHFEVMDPEATGATHPLMTQYTFGVNLTF